MKNKKAVEPKWAERDNGTGLVDAFRHQSETPVSVGTVIVIAAPRNGRMTRDEYMVLATHGRDAISHRDAVDEMDDAGLAGMTWPVTVRRLAAR
jgi:hypothetical protein